MEAMPVFASIHTFKQEKRTHGRGAGQQSHSHPSSGAQPWPATLACHLGSFLLFFTPVLKGDPEKQLLERRVLTHTGTSRGRKLGGNESDIGLTA